MRMVGRVDYDETRFANITAWVSGRLERLFVDYTGVTVKQGDHMVQLYSPELLSAQEELIQAIRAGEPVKIVCWGDSVTAGQVLVVLEAMKMEHHISAPFDGAVTEVPISVGEQVENGALLLTIEESTDE